jgi:hypothetical protein
MQYHTLFASLHQAGKEVMQKALVERILLTIQGDDGYRLDEFFQGGRIYFASRSIALGLSTDISRAQKYSEGACSLTEFDCARIFQKFDGPIRVFALQRDGRTD